MCNFQLNTPVVFIIFNRPDTTGKVFAEIAKAKPPKLFVIADGPRFDRPGEAEKCEATRAVVERVDWPCEVLKNYSETNLGCARRVASGLDWVFANVEDAIILEDDCLPHPTFFRFCEELLNHYRNDERVMVVSGDNFQFGRKRTTDSYYFSRYNHCWGWATWRRAWKHFDFDMSLWPKVRDNGWLNDILLDSLAVKYWTNIFQSTYEGKINSWAYRWTFACWLQSGLSILPNVNLVSNIGFSADATHTTKSNRFENIPREAMKFPLRHPEFIIRDTLADNFTQNANFNSKLFNRIKEKTKKLLQR